MQARSKPASVAKLTPDQLRMRELERDLAIAREERDILKKAAAWLKRNCRSQVRDDW